MLERATQLLVSVFSYRAMRYGAMGILLLNAVRSLRDGWFSFQRKQIQPNADAIAYAKTGHLGLEAVVKSLLFVNTTRNLYQGKDTGFDKTISLLAMAKEAMSGGAYLAEDPKKPLVASAEQKRKDESLKTSLV